MFLYLYCCILSTKAIYTEKDVFIIDNMVLKTLAVSIR